MNTPQQDAQYYLGRIETSRKEPIGSLGVYLPWATGIVAVIEPLLAELRAPINSFPPPPLARPSRPPNLAGHYFVGKAQGVTVYTNPYFFSGLSDLKPDPPEHQGPGTLESIGEALWSFLGFFESDPKNQRMAVPPEIGRIIEEGYERGYAPHFTDKGFALYDLRDPTKLLQTRTLPVLMLVNWGQAHPPNRDFDYWDEVLRRGRPGNYKNRQGESIPEDKVTQYQKIKSAWAMVTPESVLYPRAGESLQEQREAAQEKRGAQRARDKAKKAITSGTGARADALAIGLTEQGYENLLNLAWPYMKGVERKYDLNEAPPEYGPAVSGALAFLARQYPTVLLGRGPVSEIARNVIDVFFRNTLSLPFMSESDRKEKLEKLVQRDREARRKLDLWIDNGWDHAGLKAEDRFYPGEAGYIAFDQTYSLPTLVVPVLNSLHLGKAEAQRAGEEAYDKRDRAIADLRARHDQMPEIREKREREEREERLRKERIAARPGAKLQAEQEMRKWADSLPVVNITKLVKARQEFVVWANGSWYRTHYKYTPKRGHWPLYTSDGYPLSREITQAPGTGMDPFIEAYALVAQGLPAALPVPPRTRNAFSEALKWDPSHSAGLSGLEKTVARIQEYLGA